MTRTSTARRMLAAAAACALLAGATACGDDDADDSSESTEETTEATTDEAGDDANGDDETGDDEGAAGGETVVVAMTDYAFDLDDELPVGTTLELVNESAVEVHELVLFKLDDAETRDLDELTALSQEEFNEVAEMRGVGYAAPDSDEGVYPMGPLVLSEPGRWVALCAIPTGADPEGWLAAAAAAPGPPQVDGGPPHLVQGMVALIEVTD